MGTVWARETARDRSLEIDKEKGGSATRSWLVRVDDPTTSLTDIQAAVGVSVGDLHPDETDLSCEKVSVRATEDTGLLYVVTADYAPEAASSSGSGEGGSEEDPGEESEVDGRFKQWSGSSSVASEPIFMDVGGNIMTNSAGDPLEGLEAEVAQFHLQLTTYYNKHTTNDGKGWRDHSVRYTNTVNLTTWNGGLQGQWKCQGSSAKLIIDRGGPNNAPRAYWEVTWDFAFRADYWVLRPWDVGFNELVNEDGEPQSTPGVSSGALSYQGEEDGGDEGSGSGSGGPCEGGLSRRSIKGQDGKPVRQPVALQNGVAKAPCTRPDELWFDVYASEDFGPPFGEVFTPQP